MGLLNLFGKKQHIKFPTASQANKARERDEIKAEQAETQRREKEAYNRAFREARVRRASKEGSSAGSKRWYDSFQSIGTGSSKPHRSSGKSRGYDAWEPIGFGFDSGTPSHRRKSGSNKRYAVVGGKAYPVASKHKKKHRKQSSSGLDFGSFDMVDNWRF